MPYSKEAVGNRLAVIRREKRMTQAELSEKSGVSVESITSCERGVSGIGFEGAYKLAEALGVTLDELACRSDYTCKA